jgi:FPC/CPF motif-containing protein YcgG
MNLSTLEGQDLQSKFEAFVRDRAFPCVGAKSALARGTLKVVPCRSISSGWDDLRIHGELLEWVSDVFADRINLSEKSFENAMWERIQSLSDKDAWLDQPYDSRVSHDPDDVHFSLSFGGEAFFAVGLHPRASRPARRFETPAIVFNLHDQFEQLRDEGRYEGMRETILARDVQLAGSVNPMLTRHGEASAAAQYSGREVDSQWVCPFRDSRARMVSRIPS